MVLKNSFCTFASFHFTLQSYLLNVILQTSFSKGLNIWITMISTYLASKTALHLLFLILSLLLLPYKILIVKSGNHSEANLRQFDKLLTVKL